MTVFWGLFSSSSLFNFIPCSLKGRSEWVRWISQWREKICPSLVGSRARWRNFEMWQGGNLQHGAVNLQLKQRDWQTTAWWGEQAASELMERAVTGTTGDTAHFRSSQKVTQVCKTKPGSKDLPARTQWAEGAGINLLYFYSGRLANFNFPGFFSLIFLFFFLLFFFFFNLF